jgi:23S rRNA (cytosine1962-C5)-methyltransferase
MNRLLVWPDFRDEWIVYDDGDLIAIDKPVGVASQAADPARPDDVVTRLRAHLGGAYLGVHQRLDRDTSGVLVFSRSKEHNPALARQFEGRTVAKSYLAAVTGWPARRDARELRDRLAPGDDGTMRVVPASHPGGKLAVMRVKVVERKADRALLELALETGRTHQARVQLAHAGCPIAGDALYGGSPAPRLMLHAAAVTLVHPRSGARVRLTAPAPPELGEWLARGDPGERVYDDPAALARALRRACERRWGLGRDDAGPRATTALRLVNEEGDGLPRLAVDVYGDWLVAHLFDDPPGSRTLAESGPKRERGSRTLAESGPKRERGSRTLAESGPGRERGSRTLAESGPESERGAAGARREAILDGLASLGFDGVYLKVRPRQANVLVDTRRDDLAPAQPVRGTPAPDPLPILEEGMPLLVRLGDGLSTGLYLDQRANRLRVRELARGARVANLFAYTCAFSVAAALGGAARTISVDASAAALERGRANLAHAGVLGGRTPVGSADDRSQDDAVHTFVAEDAIAWLARAARRGERFELVVLDPPSYSSTKRGRFVADSDYAGLAAQAMAILAPGGRLLACTNHRGISRARFRRILFDAARTAKRNVRQIKDLPPPADHPVPPGAEPHTKSALVHVE